MQIKFTQKTRKQFEPSYIHMSYIQFESFKLSRIYIDSYIIIISMIYNLLITNLHDILYCAVISLSRFNT